MTERRATLSFFCTAVPVGTVINLICTRHTPCARPAPSLYTLHSLRQYPHVRGKLALTQRPARTEAAAEGAGSRERLKAMCTREAAWRTTGKDDAFGRASSREVASVSESTSEPMVHEGCTACAAGASRESEAPRTASANWGFSHTATSAEDATGSMTWMRRAPRAARSCAADAKLSQRLVFTEFHF